MHSHPLIKSLHVNDEFVHTLIVVVLDESVDALSSVDQVITCHHRNIARWMIVDLTSEGASSNNYGESCEPTR